MIWTGLSAACMAAAALVHSLLGYRRLIAPLLRSRDGLFADALARRIVGFAWHATSVLMLVSAVAVIWPGTPKGLLTAIGAAWLATGLFDAFYTKGRHIAWPVLSAAGLFALIGGMG